MVTWKKDHPPTGPSAVSAFVMTLPSALHGVKAPSASFSLIRSPVLAFRANLDRPGGLSSHLKIPNLICKVLFFPTDKVTFLGFRY